MKSMRTRLLILIFTSSSMLTSNAHAIMGADFLANWVLYPYKQANEHAPSVNLPENLDEQTQDIILSENKVLRVYMIATNLKKSSDVTDQMTEIPTIVFCHGNGDTVNSFINQNFISKLASVLRANFVVFDYPRYGKSTGPLNQDSTVAAASAAVDWATMRNPKSKIIIMGHSLGAGVAAQTYQRYQNQVSGLILLSPWTSFPALGKLREPLLASLVSDQFLSKNTYDTKSVLTEATSPVLILHGTADPVIPVSMSEEFKQIENQNLQIHEEVGVDHNTILVRKETLKYIYLFLRNITGT